MSIVALTGLPRSGKDTAANWFTARGYVRMQFSAPLKEAAALLLGREPWEMRGEHGFDREAVLPEWGFSTRWFLQRLGTECLRNQIREDFWIQKMHNAMQPGGSYVITDLRFQNEADMVRELGGIVVRIERPGVVGSDHVSDINCIKADYVVINSGTLESLATSVANVMQYHHAKATRRPAAE